MDLGRIKRNQPYEKRKVGVHKDAANFVKKHFTRCLEDDPDALNFGGLYIRAFGDLSKISKINIVPNISKYDFENIEENLKETKLLSAELKNDFNTLYSSFDDVILKESIRSKFITDRVKLTKSISEASAFVREEAEHGHVTQYLESVKNGITGLKESQMDFVDIGGLF